LEKNTAVRFTAAVPKALRERPLVVIANQAMPINAQGRESNFYPRCERVDQRRFEIVYYIEIISNLFLTA